MRSILLAMMKSVSCSPLIFLVLNEPESRGFLRLKSASPQEAMEIHANMLTDPRDLAALRRSMEITRELLPSLDAHEKVRILLQDGLPAFHLYPNDSLIVFCIPKCFWANEVERPIYENRVKPTERSIS